MDSTDFNAAPSCEALAFRSTLQCQALGEPLSITKESSKSVLLSVQDNIQADSVNSDVALNVWGPDEMVILDVGGVKHKVLWGKLEKLPNSRLGKLRNCKTLHEITELCDGYSFHLNEYFFDWKPRYFDSILNVYRNGKLHLEKDVCPFAFREDLEYWGLDEFSFEPCCQNKYLQNKEDVQEEIKTNLESLQKNQEDEFGNCICSKCKKCLWNLLENPKSSPVARVLQVISVLTIIISTLCLTLSTLPSLQVELEFGYFVENPLLLYIESMCILWFTLEYLLRFLSSPNKWKFFKSPLNMIDLLAIVPYFVLVFIDSSEPEQFAYTDIRRYVQVLYVMRILMILKLARHSKGFQILSVTLRKSSKELGLFMVVLYIGIMIFSTVTYYLERYESQTKYTSIPETFWWASLAMITMNICTDDVCPTTPLGKLAGTVCCLCGVLVIALPIPIIMNNFMEYYEKRKIQEKLLKWNDAMEKVLKTREKNSEKIQSEQNIVRFV